MICMWSSDASATATSLSLASFNTDWWNLSGAGLPGFPGKEAVKLVFVFLLSYV